MPFARQMPGSMSARVTSTPTSQKKQNEGRRPPRFVVREFASPYEVSTGDGEAMLRKSKRRARVFEASPQYAISCPRTLALKEFEIHGFEI